MFATLLNWQFSQNLKQKHADFKLFNKCIKEKLP